MISFLKTIAIILLVYLGIKYLLKWLSPYIMRYIAKKAGQRFESAFGQNPFQQPPKTEDKESTIDRPGKKPKTNGTVVGEYIDFEEVE